MNTVFLIIVSFVCIVKVTSCGTNNHKQKIQASSIPNEVIEQIINYPGLETFFHPELSDRIPLIISDKFVPSNFSMEKFGSLVHILPDSTLNNGAYLRFTQFILKDEELIVEIDYQVEGIVGLFTFVMTSTETWKLKDAKIWET